MSLVVVVVVFLKFLLRQEIIVTRVNDSLSQMLQMSTNVTTLYEWKIKEQPKKLRTGTETTNWINTNEAKSKRRHLYPT